MKFSHRLVAVTTLGLAATITCGNASAQATGAVLKASFTSDPITVDGVAERAWDKAMPGNIALCMNPALTVSLQNYTSSGTVRALWSGPVLYLLFKVSDPDVTAAGPAIKNRSGVQIFVDQYNDKFPKFEEDDSTITITATSQQTGNATNAGLSIYPTSWSYHSKSYAAPLTTNAEGETKGYVIEIAWLIGDRPLRNETKVGMEFAINSASSTTNTAQSVIFWSSEDNKGINNNVMWGEVVLADYIAGTPMPLNDFILKANLTKATRLPRGIWKDETSLNSALAAATGTLEKAKTQQQIDASNLRLDQALRGLRRRGTYPDPYDLPQHPTLPDPFTFMNGTKVKSPADWDRRRTEIKDLAQYYEFGYMPGPPESVRAEATGADGYSNIAVTVANDGKTGTFDARLTLPSAASGRHVPYPVIVELGAGARTGNAIYTNGGYAVLSIPTYSIASDNGEHKGLYFSLYPYDVTKGADAGVLMTWAWGASRGLDALQYLKAHDPKYAGLLDMERLVVTGFSRWGKQPLWRVSLMSASK